MNTVHNLFVTHGALFGHSATSGASRTSPADGGDFLQQVVNSLPDESEAGRQQELNPGQFPGQEIYNSARDQQSVTYQEMGDDTREPQSVTHQEIHNGTQDALNGALQSQKEALKHAPSVRREHSAHEGHAAGVSARPNDAAMPDELYPQQSMATCRLSYISRIDALGAVSASHEPISSQLRTQYASGVRLPSIEPPVTFPLPSSQAVDVLPSESSASQQDAESMDGSSADSWRQGTASALSDPLSPWQRRRASISSQDNQLRILIRDYEIAPTEYESAAKTLMASLEPTDAQEIRITINGTDLSERLKQKQR